MLQNVWLGKAPFLFYELLDKDSFTLYICMYKQMEAIMVEHNRIDTEVGHEEECQLNDCLFFSSAKLARVFSKIAEESFQKIGLSPSHALLLHTINIKGSIHQKEVGELLELTPSTITRFVEKLEGKGLILRKADGKNVFIYTTKKGLQMQSMILEAWSNLKNCYNNILTEEETKQFIQLSNRLIESMKG